MEEIILDILAELRAGREVDDRTLLKLSHAAARREQADKRAFAKRRLLPFYQSVKREDPARWESWRVTPELEERLLTVLRMKPRRSASGRGDHHGHHQALAVRWQLPVLPERHPHAQELSA